MIPKVFKEYMPRLNAATKNGKLDWLEVDDYFYQCNHKQYQLQFKVSPNLATYIFKFVSGDKITCFSINSKEGFEDLSVMETLFQEIQDSQLEIPDLTDFFNGLY